MRERALTTDWTPAEAEAADRAGDAEARELALRLRQGDPAVVTAVYDAHARAVRSFARRLLGDEGAAEDLVQDVFLALPGAARRFRGSASLRTFLLSIAVNHARHHLRGAARRRRALDRLAREPNGDGTAVATPDEQARRRALAAALARALDQLSLKQRAAFVLCDVEEKSSVEAAAILGIPEGTVRTRLLHARESIRAALGREGLP